MRSIPSRILALSLWAGLWLSTAAQAVVLTMPVSPDRFADTSLPGTSLAARPGLAAMTCKARALGHRGHRRPTSKIRAW